MENEENGLALAHFEIPDRPEAHLFHAPGEGQAGGCGFYCVIERYPVDRIADLGGNGLTRVPFGD